MSYIETQQYDVGQKEHEDFPNQKRLSAKKPLLSQMIDSVESFISSNNYYNVNYNIEIKRISILDDIYHPEPEKSSELLIKLLRKKQILNRVTIQSFDSDILEYINIKHPEIKLVYISHSEDHIDNFEELSFTPYAYSPNYNHVTKELLNYVKKNHIKIIPHTVNNENDMKELISKGVDGLITDYPDKLLKLIGEK